MSRWTKAHDRIADNEYLCKNPLAGWVFVCLFVKANYRAKDGIKRGQLLINQKEWARKYHIEYERFRRIIKSLQNEKMIKTTPERRQSAARRTLVTVCNYNTYNKPKTKSAAKAPPERRQRNGKPLRDDSLRARRKRRYIYDISTEGVPPTEGEVGDASGRKNGNGKPPRATTRDAPDPDHMNDLAKLDAMMAAGLTRAQALERLEETR